MHSSNPYTYLGLQDNFLHQNNTNGAVVLNPARSGPSPPGSKPPSPSGPPGPPDDEHIKNFVKHAHNIKVLTHDFPFLLQILWKTFDKGTSSLLIPYNDIDHPIYSKTLEQALTEVKNTCLLYTSPSPRD